MAEADPRKIADALDRAYAATEYVARLQADLETARYIIFSDLHKGQRDGADDFRKCERAYNAALGYYYSKGYTLFVLGDVEELWECRPKNVLAAYKYNLQLEAQFQAAGRYYRFYGNHDDDWANSSAVKQWLEPLYGSGLKVYEAAVLTVRKAGKEIGCMLVLHGHQGTSFSDRHRKISRVFVRYFWRPVQRIFGWSTTTPAKNWVLGEKHGRAMHQWASRKSKLILLAGHTHRPVMMSQTHSGNLLQDLERAEAQLAADPTGQELRERVAALRAELEWVKAQGPAPPDKVELLTEPEKPCYFNSGCCCYADGDVTGLELSDGMIKLVRWPDEQDRPRPHTLESISVEQLFGVL
jgi:hypothetical protein